ncbi:UDP-glucose 4-epimerase GalE [Pandoraea sputorum]|uniref:UDP-glucose 4-epimerase n=1 Tax=Pandoraea sputorum TaxID=93222 RepID=A0A239SLB9_9BURK|nr:UDP-glucose 4-epimerase GalE [Pandoraea sputorum]AJC17235.1 UDP-glucose 4-epimerase GalE [Pandoraea sputorum]SNU85493.1 UDP-glucose 4-epimerase [Pandoraea sputorum]VVD87472.1 UDP-glucose 4-epimerase GalE [Pandoraea sputorum]
MNHLGTILVTGGAGYIGSHTCVELLAAGYDVVILDNLCNSHRDAVARIERIAGRAPVFVEGDACSASVMEDVFTRHRIDGVIHFAALKSIGESLQKPFLYYKNNLGSLLTLIEAMDRHDVRHLVFSSSAAVYGNQVSVPVEETAALSTANPYGHTKLMAEQMLTDTAHSDPRWRIGVLRYFNPVGAHESGLIGEDPGGTPNNLMPFVAQVAVGKQPVLKVYGGDWPTPDGTGIRDYIHVVDLARGHLAALAGLGKLDTGFTVNLGTGEGRSVLEVVRAFEAASGREVPFQIVGRRSGDIGMSYANPARAQALLGWRAEHDLARMCADHWRWQHQNPNGYR